jgi:hypothetical protein
MGRLDGVVWADLGRNGPIIFSPKNPAKREARRELIPPARAIMRIIV